MLTVLTLIHAGRWLAHETQLRSPAAAVFKIHNSVLLTLEDFLTFTLSISLSLSFFAYFSLESFLFSPFSATLHCPLLAPATSTYSGTERRILPSVYQRGQTVLWRPSFSNFVAFARGYLMHSTATLQYHEGRTPAAETPARNVESSPHAGDTPTRTEEK